LVALTATPVPEARESPQACVPDTARAPTNAGEMCRTMVPVVVVERASQPRPPLRWFTLNKQLSHHTKSSVAMIVLNLLLVASFSAAPLLDRPWMNAKLSPDKRTELLLAVMTVDEKVAQLGYGGCGSLNDTIRRNPNGVSPRRYCLHRSTLRSQYAACNLLNASKLLYVGACSSSRSDLCVTSPS
jgi:hypothetical protein